jgi:anti-sigma28 factor (negative regulator of flagellin synthesis)
MRPASRSNIVTTIKDPSLRAVATDGPRPVTRSRRVAKALEFHRETTESRRLYERTRLAVESERSEKIRSLKEAVKNGTYAPNLSIVAERLLGDLKQL